MSRPSVHVVILFRVHVYIYLERSDPISTRMPLVSVQISVGARVLKPWGIVCVVAIATLWDLYVGVRDGSIGGASSLIK